MLEFRNLSFGYKRRLLFEKFNLHIHRGEKIALVGANGAGKTTLIHLAANFYNPIEGHVLFKGEPFKKGSGNHRRDMGIVLSERYLIDTLTPFQYWNFVGELLDVPSVDLQWRVDSLFSFLNLNRFKKNRIESLSLGTKAKIAFGSALLHDPSMLLLDEPFVNLDTETGQSVSNFIKNLGQDKTVLVASHNIDCLMRSGFDRFIILDQGRIVEDIDVLSENGVKSFEDFLVRTKQANKTDSRIDWM